MSEASQRVLEVRRRVIGRVKKARSGVASLAARVTAVMSDPNLSIQGRQREAARIIEEGRGAIEGELAGARRDIEFVAGQAERHLEELTEVTPQILATRAATNLATKCATHSGTDVVGRANLGWPRVPSMVPAAEDGRGRGGLRH